MRLDLRLRDKSEEPKPGKPLPNRAVTEGNAQPVRTSDLYQSERAETRVVESTLMSTGATYSGSVDLDTDASLVRRAREGDFSAFEALFDRHRSLSYRFAYQMTSSRDDAEDVVQEAFVRAYQNLHRYRDEAKFTTWILRIVTNLCTDRARSTQRRSSLEQQEAAGALEWMTLGVTDDPIHNLELDRRKIVLKKALNALPVHHRSVIILRDIEGREYPDIASVLGCTIGGAKLRVLRARRALRDRVAPFLGEDK